MTLDRGSPSCVEARTGKVAFGAYLARHRRHLGLTVRDAAAMAGLDHSTISLVENGKRRPSRHVVLALAECLGMDIDAAFSHAGCLPPPATRPKAMPLPVHAIMASGRACAIAGDSPRSGVFALSQPANRVLKYVRITCDALRGAGIACGDLVPIDASDVQPSPGRLVQARVGRQRLLRYWFPHGSGTLLRAAHPAYPDVWSEEVEVLGVALGYYSEER
jgi:DNA-binding XRE family transcriptional regulator